MFHHRWCMKPYIQLLPGGLFLCFCLGCGLGPMSATDGEASAGGNDTEPSLDSIIKPGVTIYPKKQPVTTHSLEGRSDRPDEDRVGREEFGLAPVIDDKGEADLEALTAALQAYAADQMIPVSHIHDLNILVQQKFLRKIPAPPPGMKFVWDNRLQVSLAANN